MKLLVIYYIYIKYKLHILFVHTFRAHANRISMQQKLFKTLLPQVAGAYKRNTEKEAQKPRPKLKKYVYYVFTKNICFACNQMQVVIFCKKVLIL